ncbi:uncharacterized protein LOC114520931 [Dendronephthya gigantea]|uniref:uncharacterized protein LOC114520931 n=1 Tax=Dendronephthya gigantea TaxID=151771 RepID=UPI00106BEA1B|nr:uncharacterized protein LOC114520931 [Dendronephthya gigantea]
MPKPGTSGKEKTSIETSGRGKKASEKRPRSAELDASEKGQTAVDDFESRINAKIDKLTSIVSDVAGVVPIVRELKAAYDQELSGAEVDLLRSDSDGENNSHTDDLSITAPVAKKQKLSHSSETEGGIVDSLILEVTENEQTGAALPGKIESVLNSILAHGLNETTATSRKEKIHRPENYKLLKVTKVNQEIWDISQKSTRAMDARLQKMQEMLIKGLTPVATLAGAVGEAIEGSSDMPEKATLWEGLSNAMVLMPGANHTLNMCRRDLFKADLDKDYKTLCNNKHPVEGELFGEDLIERLKTVKESNKASKQLKHSTTAKGFDREKTVPRGHFLSQRRGRNHWQQWDRPRFTDKTAASKQRYNSQSMGNKKGKQK